VKVGQEADDSIQHFGIDGNLLNRTLVTTYGLLAQLNG
jgi:hypothetical protein